MMTNGQLSKVAAFTFIVSLLSAAHAAQFSVHLVAWTGWNIDGTVDTATDEFRITSWVDSSPKPVTRVPALSQFPLTLRAFTAMGSPYDIPDIWDGQVGSKAGFAFFLPIGQDLTTVQWIQGPPGPSWQGASFGWGGLRNSLGGIVLRNHTSFCYLPDVGPSATVDIGLQKITVTPVPAPTTLVPGPASIPPSEPFSLGQRAGVLIGALVLICLLVWMKKRK